MDPVVYERVQPISHSVTILIYQHVVARCVGAHVEHSLSWTSVILVCMPTARMAIELSKYRCISLRPALSKWFCVCLVLLAETEVAMGAAAWSGAICFSRGVGADHTLLLLQNVLFRGRARFNQAPVFVGVGAIHQALEHLTPSTCAQALRAAGVHPCRVSWQPSWVMLRQSQVLMFSLRNPSFVHRHQQECQTRRCRGALSLAACGPVDHARVRQAV